MSAGMFRLEFGPIEDITMDQIPRPLEYEHEKSSN